MKINKKIFDNGLRLVHNEDTSTQMVALNIVYDVGARDEHPEHTGFAHLFEHLMFGGSVHIPDYDAPLQLAGGENTIDELGRETFSEDLPVIEDIE